MCGRFNNLLKLTSILCFHRCEREPILPSCFTKCQSMGTSIYSDGYIRAQMENYIYYESGDIFFLGHDHVGPSNCVEYIEPRIVNIFWACRCYSLPYPSLLVNHIH